MPRVSGPTHTKGSVMAETIKPVGVTGAEYRRQWNKLNRERMREAQRAFYKRHPEKKRKIPRSVVERYRKYRRKSNKPHYLRGWEEAKNRRTKWTAEESDLVLNFAGTDRELSAVIGRSINAIQRRRYRLKVAI